MLCPDDRNSRINLPNRLHIGASLRNLPGRASSGKESNRLAPVCHRLPTGAFQPADLSRGTPVRVKLPAQVKFRNSQIVGVTRIP
jgi:hypothetical protein